MSANVKSSTCREEGLIYRSIAWPGMGCENSELRVQGPEKNKDALYYLTTQGTIIWLIRYSIVAPNVVHIKEMCSMWFFRALKAHKAHKNT